ncbi:MAG: fumarylacetoacetate hydrolase family protein [Termitinemataceae bacterium]
MVVLPIQGTEETVKFHGNKIIAVGLNYHAHISESKVFDRKGLDVPKEPVLFAKTPNVLVGPGEPIVIPAIIERYNFEDPRIDPEAELAVVISKTCKRVSPQAAWDYILGYTCFNDVSQRNIQKMDSSGWFRGKSFDTFGPIGPVIVPPSIIKDPQNLVISCRINGTTTQSASTRDMIFPIPELISFISQHITLESGDIIATGTPSGVSPIRAGDIVEVEIEGIGILKNPVIHEQ